MGYHDKPELKKTANIGFLFVERPQPQHQMNANVALCLPDE